MNNALTGASYYLNLFGVTEPQMAALCAEAMKGGGNYCDLYFENTTYSDLMLRDSAVGSGGSHVDYGCGVRVLSGDKTGYSYSESTDAASLTAAAKAAGCIGDGKALALKKPATRGVLRASSDFYPVQRSWRDARSSEFLPFLEKLDSMIRSKDSRVSKVIAMLSASTSDVLMYNSFGEMTFETRPMASISLSVVFSQDGRNENRSVSRSYRMGVEFLSDALLEEISADAVKGIDSRFEARRPKGGQMKVVMGAGASGILLHEAMGHAFEADFNRKGQSVFAGKMGTRICPAGINIVDDATLPHYRGSLNYDDEGVPGQKTYMVTDGVLTSYLHDRISAAWYGVSPTGNGRRESFRYNPIPRMRSTYMEGAQSGTVEDLIAEAGNGIFVDEFSNGQVKIGEGDFTFYVKSGYLIENGRLTMPVKDINIIGNGPQALADIEGVASDLIVDPGTWTCGKEQSVPVSCGIPSVLISNLTVGGN